MKKVYLIGHGNVSADIFLEKLTRNEIKTLIDVRSIPFSEHAGQFNKEPLKLLLSENGIKYRHLGKELGGRTKGFDEYVKTKEYRDMKVLDRRFAWFKKYMKEEEFKNAMEDLKTTLDDASAIMCSETDINKCHRIFIGRKLRKEGLHVENIKEEKTEMLDQNTILKFQ